MHCQNGILRYFFAPCGLLFLLVAGTACSCLGASFSGVGDLPGGDTYSYCYGVSADGVTVVGKTSSTASGAGGREAFLWTNGVMIGLGDLPTASFGSQASGVSGDGSLIVGYGYTNSLQRAVRWTAAGSMLEVGVLPGFSKSVARAISADGSAIVGYLYEGTTNQAFRSTNGVMAGLGDLGGAFSDAYGVSADGAVVVGGAKVNGTNVAFRWTAADGMQSLGTLPGHGASYGYGISLDGQAIVGYAATGSTSQAFLWTAAHGMAPLGDLSGGDFYSRANAANADGSVVVGTSRVATGGGGDRAFIWDASGGMREVAAALADLDVDTSGWTLTSATGVSADGLIVAGVGTHNGKTEGWVADLTRKPVRVFIK